MPQVLVARPIGIVRYREHLGIAGLCWRKRVDLEFTKPTPEREVLLGGDVLIPKEDHFPVEQRLAQHSDGGVIQLGRQVDAGDHGADGG